MASSTITTNKRVLIIEPTGDYETGTPLVHSFFTDGNEESEPPSEQMMENLKAHTEIKAKHHAIAKCLRHGSYECSGHSAQIRKQGQALHDDSLDKRHIPIDSERLAEVSHKTPPVSKKQQQLPKTIPAAHDEAGHGIDLDQQTKTAWWGLMDATKDMADVRSLLIESQRLLNTALAEVARACGRLSRNESVLIQAQGELAQRQQEVRRLQEQVKKLTAELKEKDDRERDSAVAPKQEHAQNATVPANAPQNIPARKTSEKDSIAGENARNVTVTDGIYPKDKSDPGHGTTPNGIQPAEHQDEKVLDDVAKMIGELELRYTRINESIERTHLMFREALTLVVPGYGVSLGKKPAWAKAGAARAAPKSMNHDTVL